MLISIIFALLWSSTMSTEKFRDCANENCLLIQCYLPISCHEFVQAAENALSPFQDFIERQQVFISYHLCTDLSVENIEEAGACLYGVLFRFLQYDTNLTLHQRILIKQSEIQDETIAIIMDTISKILYRIEFVNDLNDVKDEDLVIINAQSLLPRVHLKISQTILNYGQWFSFVYNVNKSMSNFCLYEIYASDHHDRIVECADENTIQIKLEEHLQNRSRSIESYRDLVSVNTFPKLLPCLYFLTDDTSKSSIDQNINMIDVDISKFPSSDIEQHSILRGSYPFCLFWSPKRKRLERLGDRPSTDLLIELFQSEENDIENRRNIHGMIDDEVRYKADQQADQWQINPDVLFLKQTKDFDEFDKNEKVFVVLFTVKWDPTSKLARQSFHQLAKSLLKTIEDLHLLDIDCYDWTDICEREMIDEWPTLIVKDQRGRKHLYSGSTDPNQILLFIIRSIFIQPYHLNEDHDVKSFEMLLDYQPVIVFARIEHGKESLLEMYQNSIEMFVNDEKFFFIYQYSTDGSSITVKQKYGDLNSSFQPIHTVLPFNNDLMELKTLLTSIGRQQIKPFLPWSWLKSTSTTTLLLAASQSELSRLKKDSITDQPVLWIDTNSPWIQMINQYGEIQYPALIYLDLEQGVVFVNNTFEMIDIWLKSIQNQSIEPFYRLMPAEMIDRPTQQEIDFSESRNDEELMNEYHLIQEASQRMNEHGIGFDSDGLPVAMNI